MGTFTNNRIKQRKRQRRLNKGWMLFVGILAVIVGISLIFFSSHVPQWIPTEYSQLISSTVMPLGQVIISVAVTALLFEHFGYVDYTTNRVCDALARDEVLNVLTSGRKEELKDLLFEDIYLGHQPDQDPMQLVRQLDKDTDELLADYYYEEYHTSCDISIMVAQDGQYYFRKDIHRTFTAKPIRADHKCQLSRLYHSSTNDIPSGTRDSLGHELTAVSFTRLVFNDKPLEYGKDYRLVKEDKEGNPTYATSYRLKLTNENLLKIDCQGLRVEMAYTTHVRCTDPLYSITVDKPCKSFSCHFSINIPNYNLHVKSYGFMAFGSSTRKMHIQTQNGVTVRFRSWILPGDGAVAVLTPKQSISAHSFREMPVGCSTQNSQPLSAKEKEPEPV